MTATLRRGPKWSRVTIALGLIAAVAIVPPAFGGPSLKKLVRKEVAKQISKATGPQGPQGAQGAQGIQGSGGAVAFAHVVSASPGEIDTVDESLSKGITDAEVTHPDNGLWCFYNLPFTVKNAVASARTQNAVITVTGIGFDSAACAGDEDLQAFETLGNTGGTVNNNFHILLN